ncbi:MAG: hypothetical protein HN879_09670 [Flavobacteriaceae bacterium]|jgi:stearoyl-CoA desaturase (Delta-9 desaturase)|nr:hypothetical protein [Flavobacteriaceae bacterium]
MYYLENTYKTIHATENYFVSIGEGWHNWHHKYPFDYAASEFGIFYQYNPTKLFLDTMYYIGSATDFKRATSIWEKKKLTSIRNNLKISQ